MLSQDLKNESPQTLSSKVDDFVISFYASHIEVDKMIPAPQSVLIKKKSLVNAAQMSLTLRNFMNLLLKLKRNKISDFHPIVRICNPCPFQSKRNVSS
jgi:hypothetical protein